MTPTTEDRNRIADLLAPLIAIFPNHKLNPAGIEVYVTVLVDLDPIILEAAVFQSINECKFFPAPSELRRISFELSDMSLGIPTAYQAWDEVMTCIRAGHHRNGSPFQYSHPTIKQTVKMLGGLMSIAVSTNPSSERARFVEAYREFRNEETKSTRLHVRLQTLLPEIKTQLLPAESEVPA